MPRADPSSPVILVHGAGELASGVAHTLFSRGWRRLLLTDLPEPRAVRRTVCFSEAIFDGRKEIEGVEAALVDDAGGISAAWKRGVIAVLVDAESRVAEELRPTVFIEASMGKRPHALDGVAPHVIALGPGYRAPQDCHAVVETQRCDDLGGVIWKGSARADTAPAEIMGYSHERVHKASRSGVFHTLRAIGDRVHSGDILGRVHAVAESSPNDTHQTLFIDENSPVIARITGLVRGLLRDGMFVREGEKLGDIDPREDELLLTTISDKARRIGEGAYEAIAMRLSASQRQAPAR